MALEICGTPVQRVGIIGSGQIGPDIALHFTKVLHGVGGTVTVVDVSADALERGRAKLEKKIDRGVKSGAFKQELAQAMKDAVTWTDDYSKVSDVQFIVEAATEDRALKGKIFAQLEKLCAPTTVFASNSSHLEPEVIFDGLADPTRAVVIHYFFPAERNPVVEIVPSATSTPALVDSLMNFYEAIGKIPLRVGSRYGYAIDPIFEGMFQVAALLVEQGEGTTREIDAVCCRALGYTVGPFTAMNLTGGNPITHHGLSLSGEKLMPWFRSPKMLSERVASGEPWETPKRGETVELEPERERRITDALRGGYFALVGHILDSGITNVADLELGIEVGLDMTPPFTLMNKLGVSESLALAKAYCASQNGFALPACLQEQSGPWQIPSVLRRDIDGVAVLTIRRPKVLNAFDDRTYKQLEQHICDIAADDAVVGAVVTGFGVKAFVSGADINFLAGIQSPEQGREVSAHSNRVMQVVEETAKPVVCALNGLAFGGGCELAMACNARIARAGIKVLAGQPEVNLGIIPGAGGTQRLPRWIGVEAASQLLRTGRPVSSARALELGLISKEVTGDLVGEAVAMVRQAASGKQPLPEIERGPIKVPAELPAVELGHLSRAVDALLVRAILEGCSKPLAEGLSFESDMFGEICKTKDMRIGVDNFIANGPSKRAEFVHE